MRDLAIERDDYTSHIIVGEEPLLKSAFLNMRHGFACVKCGYVSNSCDAGAVFVSSGIYSLLFSLMCCMQALRCAQHARHSLMGGTSPECIKARHSGTNLCCFGKLS